MGVFISSSNALDRSGTTVTTTAAAITTVTAATAMDEGINDCSSDPSRDDYGSSCDVRTNGTGGAGTCAVEVETDNYLLWTITLGG